MGMEKGVTVGEGIKEERERDGEREDEQIR